MRKRQLFAIPAVLLLIFSTLSGCTTNAATDAGGASQYSSLIMIVVLVAVFYFLLIRPENKKKKKIAEMRSELAVGNEITTIGGMVGTICAISGDLVTFETGEDRVRIQITKWAISSTGKDTTGTGTTGNGSEEKKTGFFGRK